MSQGYTLSCFYCDTVPILRIRCSSSVDINYECTWTRGPVWMTKKKKITHCIFTSEKGLASLSKRELVSLTNQKGHCFLNNQMSSVSLTNLRPFSYREKEICCQKCFLFCPLALWAPAWQSFCGFKSQDDVGSEFSFFWTLQKPELPPPISCQLSWCGITDVDSDCSVVHSDISICILWQVLVCPNQK